MTTWTEPPDVEFDFCPDCQELAESEYCTCRRRSGTAPSNGARPPDNGPHPGRDRPADMKTPASGGRVLSASRGGW